jgi:hypothetical protein
LGRATRQEELGKGVGDRRSDRAARGGQDWPGAGVCGRAACPSAQQGQWGGCQGGPAVVPGGGG